MPAARTVMSTAFRCTPKANSRRVPSNKHRKAVAPPTTFTAKSTQFSIMARVNVLEENRDSASLRMQGQMPRSRVSANPLEVILLRWCPGQGSNLHDGITRRGILSPLCLPVSPPGLRWRDCVRKKGERAPFGPVGGGVGIEPTSTALQGENAFKPDNDL